MTRIALAAGAAALLLAGFAHAETKPPEKPATPPKVEKQPTTPPKAEKSAKPDTKTATGRKRVTYACDGGVGMVVT